MKFIKNIVHIIVNDIAQLFMYLKDIIADDTNNVFEKALIIGSLLAVCAIAFLFPRTFAVIAYIIWRYVSDDEIDDYNEDEQ